MRGVKASRSKVHAHVYADRRWEPLRQAVMARDCWRCQICGGYVRDTGGPWTDEDGNTRRRQDHPEHPNVDHIIPLDVDEGLAFEIDNLRTLHAVCHQTVGQREERRGKRLKRDDGW